MATIQTNDSSSQITTVTDAYSLTSTQGVSQTTPNGNFSNDYSTLQNYAQNTEVNNSYQPTLPAPSISQFDMYAAINTFINSSMKTMTLGINNDTMNRKSASDKVIKTLNDSIEKMERARKKAHSRNILSIITDVFTCIGAALSVAGAFALTVATGTAAAPLLVVTSLMFMQTVASVISKHAGGPDMSISNGITSLSMELLKGFGMSDEQAKKFAPIMALGLTLAFMAATLASGNPTAAITPLLTSPELLGNGIASIAKESGASEEDSMYIGMAATFTCALVGAALMGVQAGKVAQLATQGKSMAFAAQLGLRASQAGILVGLASSGTTIGSSSLDISVAQDEKMMAYDQATVHKINALIQQIMQAMADKKDDISTLMNQSTDMLNGMTTSIKQQASFMQNLTQFA